MHGYHVVFGRRLLCMDKGHDGGIKSTAGYSWNYADNLVKTRLHHVANDNKF